MTYTISEQQEIFAPLTDKRIYVVGPQGLQNELLVHFLERETGLQCQTKESIRHIPLTDGENSRLRKQILWDCLEKDSGTVVAEIKSHAERVLAHYLVALFNVNPDSEIEEQAVALGIRGFFYEGDSLELFLKGVRAIFEGELWLSREIMAKCTLRKSRDTLSEENGGILTQREKEILAVIAIGYTNDEIANKLCISPHTVKTHIYNIFQKIDVATRLQAALWAAENL